MAEIPFVPPLDDVRYGRVDQLTPLIRRVIAENPSKFSYRGTGTYIVGHGDVAVIDPGPDLDAHRDALTAALQGETVRAILVTHCHADHSPLAAWLRESTGAPTVAFGPHGAVDETPDDDQDDDDEDEDDDAGDGDGDGDSAEPDPKKGESTDVAFMPDLVANDGDLAVDLGEGLVLRAVHTPGHTSNHSCFTLDAERALFSGDHVMGWSTTVVSPPDGDMRAYIESLRKVAGRHDSTLWPTHGNPVTDPEPFLAAYLAHRLEREAQVLAQVRAGVDRIPAMVKVLYAGVHKKLHKAAGRSVLSHLVKLIDDGMVTVDDPTAPLTRRSTFHPA